jgi:alpha-amylase/alpha-mannosidase (GH57 family)
MPDSAFCIHAHFYQPPREDPLTEIIPNEEGASPNKNWNERIHFECYKPNAELGNFGRISFNVGPTLLEWMLKFDNETATKIIGQEKQVYQDYGFPLGMAQAYNHTILPLATVKDKRTQIKWGMAEFLHRFGHPAEGIWLPESAVDNETLRIAVDCGAKYVILAPWQCENSVKNLNQPGWVELGNGKQIAAFFYNQELSTRVSFDPGSTSNADEFLVKMILPEFMNGTKPLDQDKLLIIASDGELYGHHQKFRDQFLARLTSGSMKGKPVIRSTPAEWLLKHSPRQSVSIVQRTSWSCHHGIRRWSENCGCTPHSDWKSPLRNALDQVALIIDPVFEQIVDNCGADPYDLRDDYIQVMLGIVKMDEFLHQHLKQGTSQYEYRQIAFLLRAQYERQRMYTSCGWFFDDFDRIEPRNNVKYAAQAVWLTIQAAGDLQINPFITAFNQVISPRTGLRADQVFLQHTQTAQRFWADGSSHD